MINVFSLRTKRKLWNYGLTALLALSAVVIQTTILSRFPVRDTVPVYCNLPLTLVIIWGALYGSPMPPITPDELRMSTVGQIFLRQLMSGSVAGALMGLLMASLFNSMLPVFPFYLPIAGWFAGYFCLRNINKQNLLCMPLTFVITLLAESAMAWQLSLAGHPGVLENLMQIALPEATLNTIIAPFIYFPLRRYYEVIQIARPAVER